MNPPPDTTRIVAAHHPDFTWSEAYHDGTNWRRADDNTVMTNVQDWSVVGPGARIARERRVKRMFLAEAASGNEQKRRAA